MDTLIIEKQNEVYLTVDCDPNIQERFPNFLPFMFPVINLCLHFVTECGMVR